MILGLISISTWSLDICVSHLSPFVTLAGRCGAFSTSEWSRIKLFISSQMSFWATVLGVGGCCIKLDLYSNFLQKFSPQPSNFCPEVLVVLPSLVSPENLVCILWVSEYRLTDGGLKADTC